MHDFDCLSWLPITQAAADIPTTFRSWLEEPGSLTQRLSALYGEPIQVKVAYEGWQPLRADECAALQLSALTEGWVREVFLCAGAEAWVFARSVTCREVLESNQFFLTQLGNRALGHVLFSDPAFRRGAIEICRYPFEKSQEMYWARRSVFWRDAQGLLVSEVFLPALWSAAIR